MTLKRSAPLKRTGGKPAVPNAAALPPRKKRRPVKAVSDKRRLLNEERRDVMLEVRTRTYCEACPVLLAAGIIPDPACVERHHGRDGHEVLTRGRGGSIVDPANILYACRPSHEWITTHGKEAKRLGLVRSAFQPDC